MKKWIGLTAAPKNVQVGIKKMKMLIGVRKSAMGKNFDSNKENCEEWWKFTRPNRCVYDCLNSEQFRKRNLDRSGLERTNAMANNTLAKKLDIRNVLFAHVSGRIVICISFLNISRLQQFSDYPMYIRPIDAPGCSEYMNCKWLNNIRNKSNCQSIYASK